MAIALQFASLFLTYFGGYFQFLWQRLKLNEYQTFTLGVILLISQSTEIGEK